MDIEFDLETSPLEIKTYSKLKSKERVDLIFYSAEENYNHVGGISFYFGPGLEYTIRRCQEHDTAFPTNVPPETGKLWRIALLRTSAGRRIVVHCNEVRVLDFVLSDSTCSEGYWSKTWGRNVAKIRFTETDTASEFYRSQPGMQMII